MTDRADGQDPANPMPELRLADTISNAPFSELHHRTVDAPIAEVWPHCLQVTAREVRAIGPLFALRGLPAMVMGKRPPTVAGSPAVLDLFAREGFVVLRRDAAPADGRAVVIFGAAGKFWSLAHNAPKRFEGAQAFLDFDEPAFAKTTARLEAIDLGNGTTRVETETLVVGTDKASTRKFAPYWAVIRLPSGLIRRSWLAAIDRRTRKAASSLAAYADPLHGR